MIEIQERENVEIYKLLTYRNVDIWGSRNMPTRKGLI